MGTSIISTTVYLKSQLCGLEKILDDFLQDTELHIAELKMKEWRAKTETLLISVGRNQGLEPISRVISEINQDPVSRLLESVKKYRTFLTVLIKEIDRGQSVRIVSAKDLSNGLK